MPHDCPALTRQHQNNRRSKEAHVTLSSTSSAPDNGRGRHCCSLNPQEKKNMVPSTERSSQQFSRRSTADNTHRSLGPHDPGNGLGPPSGSSRCRPGFNVHRPLLEESTSFSATPLMDNSILVYIPMKLKCGVTVNCRPDVLTRCPSVLQDLNNDVEGCLDVLPESVHSLVRRTKIWINTTYYYGPTEKPRNVNHSTAHHHEGWLFWARDIPEKAGGIEIYNCFDYQAMRLHWQGSGLLLHELCHLIHQFTLPNGLENATVIEAFERATKGGLYDRTLRRDWAGQDCEDDMAYCMVNHKEFFSEMSVTYLSEGYRELDEKDNTRMDLCSPPLMAPEVVQRLRSNGHRLVPIDTTAIPNDERRQPLVESQLSFDEQVTKMQSQNLINRALQLFTVSRRNSLSELRVPHCNKFYPFTKGQLQKHDPESYTVFEDLWEQIASWHDEDDERPCTRFRKCWPM